MWFREGIRGVFWGVFWGLEGFCILYGAQEIANLTLPDIWKGPKGIPTKGIETRTEVRYVQGLSGSFGVFSGCLQGVFPCALSGYVHWTSDFLFPCNPPPPPPPYPDNPPLGAGSLRGGSVREKEYHHIGPFQHMNCSDQIQPPQF